MDYIIVIILVLQLLILAGVAKIYWKLFKQPEQAVEVLTPSTHILIQKPIPSLPDGHNWEPEPRQIVNEDGVFDRWICADCASWVQQRRGTPWHQT